MGTRKRTYIAIDLKSFFASVECAERKLDPLTTNLVVADDEHDSELLKGIEKEGRDYCAICYDCVDELKKIAEK